MGMLALHSLTAKSASVTASSKVLFPLTHVIPIISFSFNLARLIALMIPMIS